MRNRAPDGDATIASMEAAAGKVALITAIAPMARTAPMVAPHPRPRAAQAPKAGMGTTAEGTMAEAMAAGTTDRSRVGIKWNVYMKCSIRR